MTPSMTLCVLRNDMKAMTAWARRDNARMKAVVDATHDTRRGMDDDMEPPGC